MEVRSLIKKLSLIKIIVLFLFFYTAVRHTTTLLHDKETTFAIPVCNDDACDPTLNNVVFNYTNASKRQMLALAELSESCQQSIKVILTSLLLDSFIQWL